MWPVLLAQVWRGHWQLNPIMKNQKLVFSDRQKKNSKILYLNPHLTSKNYEIMFKKFHPSRLFPTVSRVGPNFFKIFKFFYYKIFFEKKNSIFNNLCTISLNTTKPPPYTGTYQGLSNKYHEHKGECNGLGTLLMWQTKNKQITFLNRYITSNIEC